jgi:hypothetical protein
LRAIRIIICSAVRYHRQHMRRHVVQSRKIDGGGSAYCL